MKKIIDRFRKSLNKEVQTQAPARLSGNEPPMQIEVATDLNELFFHIKGAWECLGENEPYWSVWTNEKFKRSNVNQENRTEFYQSGRHCVVTLFKTLERNGIDFKSFRSCLDYGVGLGRVTQWLAQKFEIVLGYDISKPHLEITRDRLTELGIQNVTLHHIGNPQEIENLPKVDVVYSMIVLQHNPPPIIGLMIREMIRALNPGGIAFFQVPTYREGYTFRLKAYLNSVATQGRMEMHVLPQSTILEIVRKENGRVIEILEDGHNGRRPGERSNTFVIQKIS